MTRRLILAALGFVALVLGVCTALAIPSAVTVTAWAPPLDRALCLITVALAAVFCLAASPVCFAMACRK